MNRAIKYRIYPTTEQTELINKTFGCCRKVWNLMLADKITHYKECGKNLSVNPASYKNAYPYLREVDSLALTSVWMHLQTSFGRFFTKKSGFPKFKSAKRSRRSYTTNFTNGNIKLSDNCIKLPKLKWVKAKLHRMPKENWNIKSATVSQDSDGKYYCSVLFEFVDKIPKIALSKENVIGLDYSTKHLYTDSNGNISDMEKYYKKSHKKLAKEQKKLARKMGSRKGEVKSANWKKQNQKINKIHKHIANQRKDFLHKSSTAIAKQYDVVGIEDISIKEQMQKRTYKNFRKSTLDNGWYHFTQMLDYKLTERGKKLIVIDKAFPSTKMCHCCRTVNPEIKNDSIRKWQCPVCKEKHDRDVNAAINIKNKAMCIAFA